MNTILSVSILIVLTLLLSSCGLTEDEQQSRCMKFDMVYRPNYGGCIDPVKQCIDKYVDVIDEKYNNPDTVSDLREDDYSNVVKTCKETFGTNK